jgi:hypothetical protein
MALLQQRFSHTPVSIKALKNPKEFINHALKLVA